MEGIGRGDLIKVFFTSAIYVKKKKFLHRSAKWSEQPSNANNVIPANSLQKINQFYNFESNENYFPVIRVI